MPKKDPEMDLPTAAWASRLLSRKDQSPWEHSARVRKQARCCLSDLRCLGFSWAGFQGNWKPGFRYPKLPSY